MADCPNCEAGYSLTYEQLAKHVRSLVWDFEGKKNPTYRQVTTFLCGRPALSDLGHDSLDAWQAVRKLGELAGLPEGWDTCPTCQGSAEVSDVPAPAVEGTERGDAGQGEMKAKHTEA